MYDENLIKGRIVKLQEEIEVQQLTLNRHQAEVNRLSTELVSKRGGIVELTKLLELEKK